MRPLQPPGTQRSVARVTGRARNLERRFAPSAAGGGGGVPFAGFGQSGPTSVPTGVNTPVVLSSGNFYTSDASVFAAAASGGIGGIEILAAGFYKAHWAVQLFDLAGHHVANPQNFVATSGEGASHWDITGMLYGSYDAPGFQNGVFAQWDIDWTTTAGVGAAWLPQIVVISGVLQSTGETLNAYASLHIEQLGTDALSFDF